MLKIKFQSRWGISVLALALGGCGLEKGGNPWVPFANQSEYENNHNLRQKWLSQQGLRVEDLKEGIYWAQNPKEARYLALKVKFDERSLENNLSKVISISTIERSSLNQNDYITFNSDNFSTNIYSGYEISLGERYHLNLGFRTLYFLAADKNAFPVLREYIKSEDSSVIRASEQPVTYQYHPSTELEIVDIIRTEFKDEITNMLRFMPNNYFVEQQKESCAKILNDSCFDFFKL